MAFSDPVEKKVREKRERELSVVYRWFNIKGDMHPSSSSVEIERIAFYQRAHEIMVILNGIGLDGGPQVAFVFCQDYWAALVKVARLCEQGQLPWRPDDKKKPT